LRPTLPISNLEAILCGSGCGLGSSSFRPSSAKSVVSRLCPPFATPSAQKSPSIFSAAFVVQVGAACRVVHRHGRRPSPSFSVLLPLCCCSCSPGGLAQATTYDEKYGNIDTPTDARLRSRGRKLLCASPAFLPWPPRPYPYSGCLSVAKTDFENSFPGDQLPSRERPLPRALTIRHHMCDAGRVRCS